MRLISAANGLRGARYAFETAKRYFSKILTQDYKITTDHLNVESDSTRLF